MTDAEYSMPLKQKLHQAVRRLKTVRSYCFQQSDMEQIDVSSYLDSVNDVLDDLCNKLETLKNAQFEDDCQSTTLVAPSDGPEESELEEPLASTRELAQVNAVDDSDSRPEPTKIQVHSEVADQPDCNPSTGSAPSLEAILQKLRTPSDTDPNVSMVPNFKSLSDEDLLGLEMISLARPSSSDSPCSGPVTTPQQPTEQLSVDPELKPAQDESENESESSAEITGKANEDPVETEQPETRTEKLQRAASVYESAHDGTDSLFSVDPVEDTEIVNQQPEKENNETPQRDDSYSVSGKLASVESVEGQDEYVRTTIKGSNLEKLDLLRQQLQRVLAEKSQENKEISVEPNPHPVETTGTVPAGIMTSRTDAEPQEMLRTGTDGNPVAPDENQAAPESASLQDETCDNTECACEPMTNTNTPNSSETEKGDPMSTTANTPPPPENASLMAGFASAAFLKDLHDEEAKEIRSPVPDQAMQAAVQSPASAAPPVAPPRRETEEDVQDYMQQLMHRLRGGSASPSPAATPAAKPAPAAAPVETAKQPTPQPENLELLKEEEFIPKSVAPEKSVNIDALRDLANQSTRSHVSLFKANEKKALYATQLLAIVGGIMGATVFGLLGSSLGPMFYAMSAVCIVGAGFAAWKFACANLFTTRPEKPAGSQPQ